MGPPSPPVPVPAPAPAVAVVAASSSALPPSTELRYRPRVSLDSHAARAGSITVLGIIGGSCDILLAYPPFDRLLWPRRSFWRGARCGLAGAGELREEEEEGEEERDQSRTQRHIVFIVFIIDFFFFFCRAWVGCWLVDLLRGKGLLPERGRTVRYGTQGDGREWKATLQLHCTAC